MTETELHVPTLIDPLRRDAHVADVGRQVIEALATSDVLLFTSRALLRGGDADDSLAISRTVSTAVIEVVRAALAAHPAWVVAKGGITSHDVAVRGLGIRRAEVVGQLFPGMVSVFRPIEAAPEAVGTPYVVFAGNVGNDDTLADWFYKTDRNRDGSLTADEMTQDAEQFFARLDTDHDGEIDPDELAQYEHEIAPEIQVMSKTRRTAGQPAPVVRDADSDEDHSRDRRRDRSYEAVASLGIGGALQGAARYSLLNMPEPVAAADADFNRSITLDEFRQAAVARFQLLDSAHQGRISLAQPGKERPVEPLEALAAVEILESEAESGAQIGHRRGKSLK